MKLAFVSFVSALLALFFIEIVFGRLPPWAVIPLALCISVPLAIYSRRRL